jgi:hypothetical protein
MSAATDPVAEACQSLADYMDTLEQLVGEPSAPGATPAARSRAAAVPEPYGQPGRALMTAHEGIRRLRASILVAVTGQPGRKPGGSDEVTAAVFKSLPRLAAGLCDDDVGQAVRYLDRLINDARSVPGIDENRRWRRLNRPRPGEQLPPRCPYCLTYNLCADVEAQIVACANPGCIGDRNGDPPVASMGTGSDGRPQIAWADGLTEMAPDM